MGEIFVVQMKNEEELRLFLNGKTERNGFDRKNFREALPRLTHR